MLSLWNSGISLFRLIFTTMLQKLSTINPPERKLYIDSIRGIAALMIVFTHVWGFLAVKYPPWFYSIVGEGTRGVQLFYIISAYTLFLTLERAKYDGGTLKTRYYFLRRFFRIAPLFYVMILVTLFFTHVVPLPVTYNKLDTSWVSIITSITFTNGFFYKTNLVPVQWSIAVEMIFYLFVPYLFLKINNLRQAKKYYFLISGQVLIYAILFTFLYPSVDRVTWVRDIYFVLYGSLITHLT